MTEIIVRKLKNGEYLGFSCTGHAGYARAANNDRDVVCAAVSVLVINTVNSIETFSDSEVKVVSDENRGEISCTFIKECDSKAKLLIDSLVLGLKEISAEYGLRFCKLTFEEV